MIDIKYRTRIKICGITTLDDAKQIAQLGADSIGLVFHGKSPRYINLETALKIRQNLPAFVTLTALFMDEQQAWVHQVIETIQPDLLQFHGNETPADCLFWKRPYIKAIPMGSTSDANAYAANYPEAHGFLLDSNMAGRQGGSGDTFDWSKIPSRFAYPLILAGGLTPKNVAQAIAEVRPWAVDVSSGVEIKRGAKDSNLIKQFIYEVNRVNANS